MFTPSFVEIHELVQKLKQLAGGALREHVISECYIFFIGRKVI
jgi:hypothetical protein